MRRIGRLRVFEFRAAIILAALMSANAFVWGAPQAPASAVVPTIVTIEWHDGNADQVAYYRSSRATPCMQRSWSTQVRSWAAIPTN